MNHELILFVDPIEASTYLILDSGINLIGHRTSHSSGRPGIGFNIPDGQPSFQGALLRIEKQNYIPLEMRGILELKEDGRALYITDDFHLQIKPPPVEKPADTPIDIPTGRNPIVIIKAVYHAGNYDLSTKTGCGTFTEACEISLRRNHSTQWGHVKKFGSQNQYNNHAVDALMLLVGVEEIDPGIYDIIFDGESKAARPQFLYKGVPVPEIWYHS